MHESVDDPRSTVKGVVRTDGAGALRKARVKQQGGWPNLLLFCGSTGEDFVPVCPIKMSRAVFLVCPSRRPGGARGPVVCAAVGGRRESTLME